MVGALAKAVVAAVKGSKLPFLPRDALVTRDPTSCVYMVWSRKQQAALLEGTHLVLGGEVGLNGRLPEEHSGGPEQENR